MFMNKLEPISMITTYFDKVQSCEGGINYLSFNHLLDPRSCSRVKFQIKNESIFMRILFWPVIASYFSHHMEHILT